MRKYRLVAKKGEGTFSEVLKAQNIKDGKYHAIKCMKNRFDSIDQVNNLREIQALRRLSPHEHIITLEEVLYDQPTGRLALVFELMDANLYELIRGRRHYLNPTLIKSYMYQLLKSLDHMHRKGIFHRDIKPENILIETTGEVGKGLKLADFGSCRGIYSKQPYTEYISTRWYRAPECLLTDGYYGPEMDLWGAGCVFFEITSLYPLFPGTNEVDQVARIHKVLGTPSNEILDKFRKHGASHVNFDFPTQKGIGISQLIPHSPPDCTDLMIKLLRYDTSERITAREALRHVYFKEMRELDMRRQANKQIQSSSNTNNISAKPKDQVKSPERVKNSNTEKRQTNSYQAGDNDQHNKKDQAENDSKNGKDNNTRISSKIEGYSDNSRRKNSNFSHRNNNVEVDEDDKSIPSHNSSTRYSKYGHSKSSGTKYKTNTHSHGHHSHSYDGGKAKAQSSGATLSKTKSNLPTIADPSKGEESGKKHYHHYQHQQSKKSSKYGHGHKSNHISKDNNQSNIKANASGVNINNQYYNVNSGNRLTKANLSKLNNLDANGKSKSHNKYYSNYNNGLEKGIDKSGKNNGSKGILNKSELPPIIGAVLGNHNNSISNSKLTGISVNKSMYSKGYGDINNSKGKSTKRQNKYNGNGVDNYNGKTATGIGMINHKKNKVGLYS